MDPEDVPDWAASFAAFCARFDDLFSRSESRLQARKYLRGLLAGLERKTTWQLAEVVKDGTPDRMQRLLYRVPWDAEAARDLLQQFVIERFGEAEAIGVLDETGIPKKGPHSAGVHQQYCGALGKIENCQVATLLTYATPRGHVFLDRRLFLPEEWCFDRARRARAKVPKEVTFQTKPEQARAMLEHAWELGVPMRWVTGDSVYGDSPALRAAIEAHGCWYVLALTSVVRCWLNPPPLELPAEQTGGRPRRAVRLAPHAPKARTVAEVIARLPREQWKRLSVGTGTKGPRIYDWARVRVIESREGFPGPEVWLLARRSVSDPKELTYYFALAPKTVSLQQLARVAGTRYTVEQVIKEAKSEVGFDRYEVRYWHSWYRHITLSMLAQVWLADQRHAEGEKNGLGGFDRARSAAPAGGGAARSLCGACGSGWPGPIGAAASATGRGSVTTGIAPGPSTPDPTRSIPPDLSTVVILGAYSAEVSRLALAPVSARRLDVVSGLHTPLWCHHPAHATQPSHGRLRAASRQHLYSLKGALHLSRLWPFLLGVFGE